MQSSRVWKIAGSVVGVLSVASLALAQTAAPVKGGAVLSSVTVTATVTQIDQKTRAVTLKTDDGQEYSFVAGDEVKNLAQVKKGDVVSATYTEALATEVKKGGHAAAGSVTAAATAQSGAKPAGVVAQQTTVTIAITAIDRTVPSVTFKGPAGNIRTIKVEHPELLQDVKVGDTVDITYTEALAIKLVKAPKAVAR